MSELRVYSDADPTRVLLESADRAEIASELEAAGVGLERWPLADGIAPGVEDTRVFDAYQAEIEALKEAGGFVIVDAISLPANHPDRASLRQKFLAEHTHGEDEVRFFAAGRGLFSLHIEDRVYEVLCSAGDLISVPANTRHWFDMGPNPAFVVLRFFQNPDGWVGHFTGSDIADRFHRLET